jgi:hypothetical protein
VRSNLDYVQYTLAGVVVLLIELFLTFLPQFTGRHAPGFFYWIFFVIQVGALPMSLGLYISITADYLRLTYRLCLGVGISLVILLLYLAGRLMMTLILIRAGWAPTLYLLEHNLISVETMVFICLSVAGVFAGWFIKPKK